MTIDLYVNKSENIKVAKDIELKQTLSGTLRDATSIQSPTILIEGIDDFASVNYMYIPEFNRYYFINDIVCVRTGLYQISASVDVLMSFKEQIYEQKGIIKRQAENWNTYIDDGTFRVYQNPKIVTKAFPNGFDNDSFVLVVAGAT